LRFSIFYLAESKRFYLNINVYSRDMVNGNMRSRSLRKSSSMIDLSKFKVPSDPARGFINISDGVERREGGVWSGGGSTTSAHFTVAMGPRDNVFTPSSPRRRIRGGDRIAPMRYPSTTPPRFPRKGAVCRCHCSALGEGHYSEQGEPVTSAPTPAIDPTPSDGGAMHPTCAAAFCVNLRLASTLAR